MNSLNILFIDFFDSFSHNIVQYVRELGHNVVVKNYVELLDNSTLLLTFDLVILGPGPGHVKDYTPFCDVIRSLDGEQLFLGICLGHQILGVINGHKLQRLDSPLHGVSRKIPITYAFLGIDCPASEGMFYNSWSLEGVTHSVGNLLYENAQVVLLDLPNALGLQFHPESVGTSCPCMVLDNALRIVYNKGNENSNEDYWCLRPENYSTP